MAEILISNKMVSKYELIGHREQDMGFEMLVGNYTEDTMGFAIKARAIGKKNLPFSLNVVYGGTSDMSFVIQPIIHKHLGFQIDVAPHNQMTARYELVEPPSIIWDGSPIQDSYTLSKSPYNSINYGNAQSMILGNGSRGEAKPYVQFDLTDLDHNIRIKKATLKLYYGDLENSNISLYEVLEEWRELNITNLNAPTDYEYLTSNYVNNTTDRAIEFEVTDTVIKWLRGLPNNGFMLASPDNATTILRTRESGQQPELIVEYISSEPINIANRRLSFKITPRLSDKIQILFEVNVTSHYRDNHLGFSVFAHDPDFYYSSNMSFDLLSAIDDKQARHLAWDMYVKYYRENEMGFKIAVAEDGIAQLPFELFVPDFEGTTDLGFEIVASKIKEDILGFTIECFKDYKPAETAMAFDIFAQGIYKARTTAMRFNLQVQRNMKQDESNLGFSVTPQFFEDATLGFTVDALTDYTGDYRDLGFAITPKPIGKAELGFTIFSINETMQFSIIASRLQDDLLPFEVSARKFIVNDILFTIEVGDVPDRKTSFIYIM